MAIMIPDSISNLENVTIGEKKVFKILKEILPEEYICWFELRVNKKYPDFIILGPDLGIVVLEVKDWEVGSIQKADLNKFELNTLGSCTNPLRQARDYMFHIVNNLKQDSFLVQKVGEYKGNLKFTYGYGVVFTKINKKSFNTVKLNNLFEPEIVLLQDDLNNIEKNRDSKLLKDILKNMLPTKFEFEKLNQSTINRIRGNLFKEVKLSQDNNEIFKVMNLEQENYAKGLGYGHRIIRGVAGSGKTVILTCRAKYLKETHKDWNILVLCYNKTLAAFLKNSISGTEETNNIEVIHMHGWINKLSKKIGFKTAVYDGDITNNILQINESIIKELPKYDAILIDEGQDLEAEWFRFIVKNLRSPEHSHLVIALDGAQNLYNRKYTFKSLGIKAVGRTIILKENYRNTREILKLSNNILMDNVKSCGEDDNDFIIETNSIIRSGGTPKIVQCENFQDEIEHIINNIIDLKRKNIQYGDMAILYPYGKYKGMEYAKIIREKLKEKSIEYDILNKDYNKYSFNTDKNRLKISTIYSAKGLDFSVVFICGINDGLLKRKEASKKLLYVGMTRARDILNITYSVKNELTELITKDYKVLYEVNEIEEKDIQKEKIKDEPKGFLKKLINMFK